MVSDVTLNKIEKLYNLTTNYVARENVRKILERNHNGEKLSTLDFLYLNEIAKLFKKEGKLRI